MTCYAFSAGATVQGFFEALEECAEGVIEEYLKDELEKRIKPALCKQARTLDSKIRVRIVSIVSVLRPVRVLVDIADGALQDIESINIGGIRVPRALTNPIRRFVDKVNELLDTVDEFVASVTGELDILKEYCDGEGENE